VKAFAENPLTGQVHIGEAATLSGVTAKMIRHYESLGLLPAVNRSESGYRLYSDSDVHTLRFIKRARDLGFSMTAIGELVNLWQRRERSSAQVKQIAESHLKALRQRIDQLQAMERSLVRLTNCCHGDDRPDCPILDDLAS
jgi:MerR family transcriptional regulator, copper efflux regulator